MKQNQELSHLKWFIHVPCCNDMINRTSNVLWLYFIQPQTSGDPIHICKTTYNANWILFSEVTVFWTCLVKFPLHAHTLHESCCIALLFCLQFSCGDDAASTAIPVSSHLLNYDVNRERLKARRYYKNSYSHHPN